MALALLGALVPGRTLAGKCDDVLPYTQVGLVLPEIELVSGDPEAAVPFFPDGVLLSDWDDGSLDRIVLGDGVTLWLTE
jgi:hypothetical protein